MQLVATHEFENLLYCLDLINNLSLLDANLILNIKEAIV